MGKRNKTPQVHRTSEQIVADMEREAERRRKRDLIVDQFYPALEKASISIDEAKALLSAFGALVMEEAMKTLKEKKIADVKESMLSVLCADGTRKAEVGALLDVFGAETLYSTRNFIEGMNASITQATTDEQRDRTLDTLKMNWDKYLTLKR